MLASIGVFGETKAEEKGGEKQEQQVNQTRIRRFELTPMASLQSEAKDSIRNFALLFGLEPFKKAIDNLYTAYKLARIHLNMQTAWKYMSILSKIKKRLKYLTAQWLRLPPYTLH